jgi:hypothetical protein
MLTIDRLIHAFHYSLRQQPDLPTRPVGVNLIAGKVTDVVLFLDELTYGDRTPPEVTVRADSVRRLEHAERRCRGNKSRSNR